MEEINYRSLFILKRAFRWGEVTRLDVKEALGIAPASATRILNKTVDQYPELLRRLPRCVTPAIGINAPSFIDDEDLLRSIENGGRFSDTGFRESELPTSSVAWQNQTPVENGALQRICHVIAKKWPIKIHYVGLKRNDRGDVRNVFPLALERKKDQWRLIANDLDDKTKPMKVFLLCRILKVEESKKRPAKYLSGIAHNESPKQYSIMLNQRLTKEQQMVVEHQLGVIGNKVRIPSRYLHEFKIEFCGNSVRDEITWPLVETIEE